MEPNDGVSTSARAQELRASLGTRREVEALLTEASATREAAVADADAIIEEAQHLSDQLLRESRTEAERMATDARLRAEGVVTRARAEAEDITRQARAAADAVRARAEAQVEEHRRRVRAELTEQVMREVTEQSRRELARVREQQQGMIGDLEASVRILGVSMESASANIAEMLGALDSLRVHSAESLGEATVPLISAPRHAETEDGRDAVVSRADRADASGPVDTAEGATDVAEAADNDSDGDQDGDQDGDADGDADGDQDGGADDPDRVARPASRSGHLVDALAALDDNLRDDRSDDDPDDEAPPLTATEAFLRSAHLDHGDPPLPPADDSEVGARYARDAMRATARARSRRDRESLEVLPEREGRTLPDERAADTESEPAGGDGVEASGKPLGWLFRSSS